MEHPYPVEVVDCGERGRGSVATRDLAPAENVLYCVPLAVVPNDPRMTDTCCGCLQPSNRPVCPHCGVATLCDRCAQPGSRAQLLHADECGSLRLLFTSPLFQRPFEDSRAIRILLRLLSLRARTRDGTLPDIRVDDSIDLDVFADTMDDFAELQDHSEDVEGELLEKFLLTAKQVKYLVAPHARGNVDLYVEMLARYNCNAFELETARGWVGVGCAPSASFLNHSCASNCRFQVDEHGFLRVFTVAPVRRGEELTIPYVDPSLPRERRQAKLRADYFFVCACPLCTADAPSTTGASSSSSSSTSRTTATAKARSAASATSGSRKRKAV